MTFRSLPERHDSPEDSRDRVALLPGDQPIWQLVFVVGLAREMSGEDLAAALDGLAESVAGFAGL
jgi:hypothetical protein